MKLDQVTVADSIGDMFPLEDCQLLCRRDGESDYSDPVAVMYPDGQTMIMVDDLDLADEYGITITFDEVDWE